MKRKRCFVEEAEFAARATVKEWVRQTLRESFLQALRQAWKIRHVHNHRISTTSHRDSSHTSGVEQGEQEESEKKTHVELSLAGVNACFSFVDRVSRAWQTKLKEEQHERVAHWIEEVYQQGKSNLWTEPFVEENEETYKLEGSVAALNNKQTLDSQSLNKSSSHHDTESQSECRTEHDRLTQETDEAIHESIDGAPGDDGDQQASDEASRSGKDSDHHQLCHSNAYCKLRALGRRRTLDSPMLSVPDALQELKEFTQNHATYWPLDDGIIDQECLNLSSRMLARDKHGAGASGNVGDRRLASMKKTVRFKVLPKSVWKSKQQHEPNRIDPSESNESLSNGDQNSAGVDSGKTNTLCTRENEGQSSIESVLLASIKRKKNDSRAHLMSRSTPKKSRTTKEQQVVSRPPFDAPLDSDGNLIMDLSLQDKKMCDGLLILDDIDHDSNGSQSNDAISKAEMPLALFGGLKHVGQTNHFLQNPGTSNTKPFMAKGNDRVTRRKQKQSMQGRLDPNRLQVGRADNPANQRSKILRTENWFDDQRKYMDLDLGWSLFEITTDNQQKRLCAFSSMEICLDDNDW